MLHSEPVLLHFPFIVFCECRYASGIFHCLEITIYLFKWYKVEVGERSVKTNVKPKFFAISVEAINGPVAVSM